MASPAGRRLRPVAVICALLMVAWGAASIACLVVQFMNYDDFGWPDENADGEVWTYVVLYLAAAASGAWVAVWGLFGLAWRPPLHLGGLTLLVAVGLEVAANVVQVNYFSDLGLPVDLGDQADSYVDRITFDSRGPNEGRAFLTALPLTTAVLPLLAWLVVLFSGAGRKRKPTPYNTAYGQPQQYQQPQPYQPQQPQQPPQQQPTPAPFVPPAQPPPQPRVAWQQAPPVVPRQRPAPPSPPAPHRLRTSRRGLPRARRTTPDPCSGLPTVTGPMR